MCTISKCDGSSGSVVDRAVRFRCPSRLGITTSISPATYQRHGDKLKDLAGKYPNDFGWAGWRVSGDGPQQVGKYTDEWGCVWEKLNPFIGGQCVEHPLSDWEKWKSYTVPDPLAEDIWVNVEEFTSYSSPALSTDPPTGFRVGSPRRALP